MKRMTFTNSSGESITFRLGSPFMINNVEGLGEVGAEIQTQKAPFQDGSTFLNAVMVEREISFNVTIKGKNDTEVSQHRATLGRVFNPKLGIGTLRYQYGNIVREIGVIPTHVPNFPSGIENRGSQFQIALFDFIAPDPYWKTERERVEQLVTFSGGLTFPLVLPTIFGNQDSEAKSRIIVNDGDSDTPLEITFEGPATTPIRIENETTGEFIEVAQSLLDGEKLVINTAFGRKRVDKVSVDGTRANAFNYINLQSTFFQLRSGNNLLTYSTGEDYEKAPVTIKFYPRYLAI